MKNKGYIFTIIGLIIIIGILLVSTFNQTKTGWVDLNKVYKDFILKKELEKKLESTQQARKKITDSLELQLKVLLKQINMENAKDKNKVEVFSLKKEEYLVKKQQFDEDNNTMAQQYDAQIYKQLNQYVQDFGKSKNYTYIYGADGSGNLMYADSENDISDEVLVFVNERYKGITK